MHGITNVVVIILLLLIVVALATLSYTFFSGIFVSTTELGAEQINQTTQSLVSLLSIEALDGNKIVLRNVGSRDISNLTVYLAERLVDDIITSPPIIVPNSIATVTINPSFYYRRGAGDRIRVSTVGGSSSIENYELLLFDNFNDGDANEWSALSGSWSVNSNREYQIDGVGVSSSNLDVVDFKMEVNVKDPITTSSPRVGWGGIQIRSGAYSVVVICDLNSQISLLLYKGPTGYITGNSVTGDCSNSFATIKVDVKGANIKAYVSNTLLIDWTDTAPVLSSGTVRVYNTYSNHIRYFDNIKIYS